MFKLETGVRQGDPIWPKLFTSLLEDIFRSMNWVGKIWSLAWMAVD